jgi:hypothetical protein
MQSFNSTLRDRLPTSGALVIAPGCYVDHSAIGSTDDPTPAHMSYEENMKNNDIDSTNIIKVFLDSYWYIPFVNIDFLPEIE